MLIFDKGFTDFTHKIDKDTGFLKVSGIVARTGLQDYMGIELGNKEEPMKVFKVYRPKEEVLKQESLDSYINSIVTDDHPKTFVTVDNIKELGKGSTSSIETFNKDGIDYVKATLTITDKTLIQKIQDGKVEISAGYTQRLVKENGIFKGEEYQYKQTDIKINHVAIVDAGRCGGACKITIDNNNIIKDETKNERKHMPKITIDGVEHEVTDCVAKFIGGLNSKIKSFDEEMKKKEDELEEVTAKKDMVEEELEKEKEAKTSDADIAKLIDAKVEMIATAKSYGVEVKSADSVLDMKKAILSAKTKLALDGKTDAYIDAAFDMLKEENIKKSQDSVVDGFQSKATDSKFNKLGKEVY